jgi:hypothetical protein
MKQSINSIFSVVHSITTNHPHLSEKVTFLAQGYAQFKLTDSRVVTIRRETYKKVSDALVMRDNNKKIVCAGLNKIMKELEK